MSFFCSTPFKDFNQLYNEAQDFGMAHNLFISPLRALDSHMSLKASVLASSWVLHVFPYIAHHVKKNTQVAPFMISVSQIKSICMHISKSHVELSPFPLWVLWIHVATIFVDSRHHHMLFCLIFFSFCFLTLVDSALGALEKNIMVCCIKVWTIPSYPSEYPI